MPNHHIIQPTNDKFRAGRRLLADTMTTGFLNKARLVQVCVWNSDPVLSDIWLPQVAAGSLHRHIMNLMELWRLKSKAAKGHAFVVADDINHMALDSSKQRPGHVDTAP